MRDGKRNQLIYKAAGADTAPLPTHRRLSATDTPTGTVPPKGGGTVLSVVVPVAPADGRQPPRRPQASHVGAPTLPLDDALRIALADLLASALLADLADTPTVTSATVGSPRGNAHSSSSSAPPPSPPAVPAGRHVGAMPPGAPVSENPVEERA